MTVEVFWGAEPRERSEVQFLKQLQADLTSQGTSAIILANFMTHRSSRQIDFLVITDDHVCHVELKNYTEPLVGHTNGPWSSRRTDGSLEIVDRQNPYVQALECRYALSDDMHSLAAQDSSTPRPAQGRKFFTQIDSVVCIFPRLAEGSQIPSDFKVKTLGYTDFLTFLIRPGAQPQWNRDHWAAFIRMQQLADAMTGRQELAASTVQQLVRDYARRFKEFYGSRLHELVPLSLDLGHTSMSSTQLAGILQEVRHVQIVGPSGCGKSHLAKHTALAMQDSDLVAVLVEAGMYEGRLSPLLNRSVGRFTTRTAEELLQAAAINGQAVLLVVDGLNECPDPLQERLLGDLSAFCLRTPTLTLITSQAAVSLPEALAGKTIGAGALSEADRKAVLSSYGSADILQLCEPFSTPYELSIAAECASELGGVATRANLFDAFIRKHLNKLSSPASVRETLRRLSLVMDERLTTWLSVDDVWRIAEQFLAERPGPASVVDEVLHCSIVATQQGKFSFSHELLGRFLAAEALLLQHREPGELVDELKKPRHQDLAQFVVTLASDPKRVAQLLNGLADWHLFADALLGNCGPVADRVVRSSALDLLRSIASGLGSTTFTIHNEYEVHISGGHEVSDIEHALLAAVGALVIRGHFVQEVVALLDATDAACRRSADLQATTGERLSTSVMVSAILAGPFSVGTKTAARTVLEACEQAHMDSRFRRHQNTERISEQQIATLLAGVDPQSYGRLLMLCSMLSFPVTLEAAALGPQILRLCWDSRAYHVRLKGLMTVQHFALVTDGHPLHDEIVAVLESFDSTNIDIMLSTMVIEVMNSYGMIESPVPTSQVAMEIRDVLQGELTNEKCERAYGIITAQFDDVIGDPYSIAIYELDTQQRTDLFTIAASGAPPHGFWNDWLLRRLIDLADPRTLPAFERWATMLNRETPYIQGVGSCYALAMEGSAQLMQTPPQLDTGCQVFYQALELLNDPQAVYAAGNEAVRVILNKAFFTRLWVDTRPEGRQVVGQEWNEPFDLLEATYGYWETQTRPATLRKLIELTETTRAAVPDRYSGSDVPSPLARALALASRARGSSNSLLVELRGIEPLTSSMRTRRATNCATAPKTLARITEATRRRRAGMAGCPGSPARRRPDPRRPRPARWRPHAPHAGAGRASPRPKTGTPAGPPLPPKSPRPAAAPGGPGCGQRCACGPGAARGSPARCGPAGAGRPGS
jgi:energy-coupling factor transporter ATP-binding protein EcfA2